MSDGVLVLNSTYEPLNVTSLARAVRLVFVGKAVVEHQSGVLRTQTLAFPLPSVIRMVYYIARGRRKVALTKKNVLLRDDYTCVYCSVKVDAREATVDHVIPRRLGGRSTWENLVTACQSCNARKRDRTPEQAGMPLRKWPREPRFIPFVVLQRNTKRDEWGKYFSLYSVSIEERLET